MAKSFTAFLIIFILISVFGTHHHAQAANHYVLAGATGNQNGSDWANAFTDLPASLVRGDTYYIGDGHYKNHTFNDPCIGQCDETDRITIKKSTIADHGTEQGYIAADHDGQAVFQHPDDMLDGKSHTFAIYSSYYTIDGAVGSGPDPSSYGFKMLIHPSFGSNTGIWEGYQWYWASVIIGGVGYTKTVSNIILFHIAAIGAGQIDCVEYDADSVCRSDGIHAYCNPSKGGTFDHIEVGYCYAYGFKQNFNFMGGSNVRIHHCYADSNTTSGLIENSPNQAHGQNINVDTVTGFDFFDNTVVDSRAFLIAVHNQFAGSLVNANIYNNLFIGCLTDTLSGGISVMAAADADIIKNLNMHHNTFANLPTMGKGALFVGTLTDPANDKSYAYNNLFYNVGYPIMHGYTDGAVFHDYSAYLKCSGTINSADETSPQRDDDAADPFVNSAKGNFHLKSGTLPIDNGKTGLGAVYALDFDGALRDARPDIGAYEYVEAADAIPPAAPAGLTVE